MNRSDTLRLPLVVTALYTLSVGVVQLFPALAEIVFGRPVVDPAVESLYGTALLALAAITFVLASDPLRAPALVWIVTGALLLGTADLVVYWALGQYSIGTVLAPVILNLVLAAWIGASLLREESLEMTAEA